jgi:integrase
MKDFLEGPSAPNKGSLAEFVETTWWPRTKLKCQESTLTGYRSILDTHFGKWWGYPLEAIRLNDLQDWVNSIQASPKRIRNIFGVMTAILELAAKVNRYPHQDHKLVILPSVIKRKERNDLDHALISELLRLAQTKNKSLAGPIWAASFLGLRRNEICGLKRGHIELSGDMAIITIQDNRQKFGETQKLKSKAEGERRVLSVPRAWGETLLSFGPNNAIYIFHDGEGKVIHPDRITKGFKELAILAGRPTLTYHNLRSACASNLREAGVSPQVIADILGHSSVDMTTIYQDKRSRELLDAFSRIASGECHP